MELNMINTINTNRKLSSKEIIRISLLSVIVFFIIYRIYIPGFPPQLSSTRLGIIILLLWSFVRLRLKVRIIKTFVISQYKKVLIALIVFYIYGLVLLLLNRGGHGITFADNSIEFIIFWSLCFYAMINLFKDVDELFSVLLYISLFQAIIVFACILFPAFRSFVDTTFNSLSYWNTARNAEEMYKIGYAYGIGCMTSTGSLQISLGALASVYFLLKDNSHKVLYWILFLIITVASAMVSRSGVIFNGVVLLVYIYDSVRPKRFIQMLSLILLGIVLIWWLFNNSPWASDLVNRMSRFVYLQNNGLYESFFIVFDNPETSLPSIVDNFFFGTGYMSGITDSGATVNVDSGYLKIYSALGLIWAILFYLIIITSIIKCISKFKGHLFYRVGIAFLLLLLVGEAKEPNILGYTLCIFYVFSYLGERDYLKTKIVG